MLKQTSDPYRLAYFREDRAAASRTEHDVQRPRVALTKTPELQVEEPTKSGGNQGN